jgi:hypothetical protein
MRIILILLILFLLFVTTKKYRKDNFSDVIDLKTDSFDTIDNLNINDATVNINSSDKANYPGSINIGKDLIIKKQFFIDGLSNPIDISLLRYIKTLPYNFEEKLCLKDENGNQQCITKEHINIIKGKRKINFKTYPELNEQCLSAVDKFTRQGWYTPVSQRSAFSNRECKNGEKTNEFRLVREPHVHDSIYDHDSHLHEHSIDSPLLESDYIDIEVP